MKHQKKISAGFTLIEVLVVVVIGGILGVAGMVSLSRYRSGQGLKLVTEELSSAIISTRRRAVSQELGGTWGMRFLNGTSSQSYQVVSGPSFASGTVRQTSQIAQGISFSNPATSSIDVWFSQLAGTVSPQIISLVNGTKDGMVGDVIVKGIGSVVTRRETGLVGYWHFDESMGTIAYDASGMGNVGTLTNTPTRQSGISCRTGACLVFNGSTNYVQYGNVLNMGLNDWTISLWMKTANAGSQYMVSKSLAGAQNYRYAVGSDVGKAKIFIQGNGGADVVFTGNTTINDGLWHNLVFVYARNGNASIYVDGVFDAAQSIASWVNASMVSTNPFRVGSYTAGDGTTPSLFFNGTLDEVRVYNRALSATEILNAYNDLK